MACDVTTLVNLLQIDGNDKLSDRDALICLASVYGTAAGYTTAQLALNNAYTNKLQQLSERDLWAVLEAVICH